jgi:hypothetical protein
MRMFLAVSLVVFGLVSAAQAQAQSFGPKNYADCVMLYAKKAVSRDAGMLIRLACKCRFQDPTDADCRKYSPAATECMITNLLPVEKDLQAWGVERLCRTKNPVGQ